MHLRNLSLPQKNRLKRRKRQLQFTTDSVPLQQFSKSTRLHYRQGKSGLRSNLIRPLRSSSLTVKLTPVGRARATSTETHPAYAARARLRSSSEFVRNNSCATTWRPPRQRSENPNVAQPRPASAGH